MESIWTVHGPVHGMHHSMDIPYGFHSGYGLEKWLGTQPKNSPYGIHMELPGECKDLSPEELEYMDRKDIGIIIRDYLSTMIVRQPLKKY